MDCNTVNCFVASAYFNLLSCIPVKSWPVLSEVFGFKRSVSQHVLQIHTGHVALLSLSLFSLFDWSSLACEAQNNVIQTVGCRAALSLGQPGPKQRLQDDHAPLSATIKPPLYLLSTELHAAGGLEIHAQFLDRDGNRKGFNDSCSLTVPFKISFQCF